MAGALSRRDIEMIFRAETDKATRPIADLGKAVKASRGQLEELIDAASRGEVSLDKLGTTTRDLKKAQDELGTARGLLTQLNAQVNALDKAEEKATEAEAKYRALSEQVAAAEQPTKRLTNAMDAAGRASAAAAERLDLVRAEAAQTRDQIESIIGPVDNVGTAFRAIATTSQEIARGLALAGNAADDFKLKAAGAAAGAAELGNFNALAAKSPLLQEQIAAISQYEDRIERLKSAEQSLASEEREQASADALGKAKQRAALEDLLQGNRLLEAEIKAVADEAARVDAVNGYRQMAADANAALADVSRFGVAEDVAAASTQRLASALSAILSPSAAANRTLDSLDASVTEASRVLEGGARSAQVYGLAMNELSSAAAGINNIAGQIDGYRAQEQALGAATARFEAARTEALALAAALEAPGENAAEIATKLGRAETAVENAGNAMQREAVKAAELAVALNRAGVEVKNLAAAELRLTAAARETAAAQGAIGKAQGGKGGLFGLNPQDATNLSYQINDIFTQLASGQSIFITLAQQGPQIWQIEGVKSYIKAIGGLLGPLGAVALGIGVVVGGVAALNKATGDTAAVTANKAFLASLGDGAGITAQQLGAASDRLQDFGAKTEDANAIVQSFAKEGLNPTYLDAYTQGVANAAEVTGTDMTAASEALTTALTGSYDSVVALNEKYPVLTDAELTQIEAMYESGRADEARQLIFDRFTSKYQDAADKMNGPWSNAWDNLKAAAARFGSYISATLSPFMQGVRRDLDNIAIGANYLLLRLRGLNAEQAGQAAVNNQGRVETKGGTGKVKTRDDSTAAGRQAVRDAEYQAKAKGKTLTAAQRLAEVERKAHLEGAKYGKADEARLVKAARAGEQATIDAENKKKSDKAAKAGESAAKKAAREADTAANKIASQQEQLQSALDSMGVKVAKVAAGSLQDQLTNAASAVGKEYDKLYRQLDAFSKLTAGKGTIGGKSIAEYRATLDANKDILTQQAQLKVYEENVNDVLAQRKQLLADIEDKAQRGEITPAAAIEATQEVTSRFDPLIANMTKAAVTFAQQVGGAKPSAELQAFIDKMNGTGKRTAGDDQEAVRKSADANIGREETKLNQILAERNSLVSSYNTLAELGIITQDEARRKSADAYNASQGLIGTQLAALDAVVQKARELGAITPQAFDAFQAKMQAIGAQAAYIDPRFAQLKQSIDGIITDNAIAGLNRIGAALVGLANGGMSAGDALKEAAFAVLDFIGQTLAMIAKLVIQMLILDAVQKATGIPVAALLQATNGGGGGGGGGGFIGSIFGAVGKLFHGGTDSVGSYGGGQQRSTRVSISPAAIAMAPRYHEGTPSVGLKANEQVAVVERGEKIMTERQQQLEESAKARAGGGGRGFRQVLAFGDDEVAAAMAGPAGEDVTVTHLRRNVPLLKQLLR